MKFFKHIKVQISAYYLITSIFVISILGFVLYYSIGNIFLNDTLSRTEQTINVSGEYLEVYIERLKGVSHLLSESVVTEEYLLNHENETEVLSLIESALETDEYINSIIIVSKDGRIISNEKSINMTVSVDMMNEHWYVDALSNGDPILTGAKMTQFSMDQDTWVISISEEIIDENGNNIGLIIIDVNYAVIQKLLSNLDLGTEGSVFILNDNDQLVYHGDPACFMSDGAYQEILNIASMDDGYHSEMNKTTYEYRLNNADWRLIGVSSLDANKAFKRQLLETLFMISFILLTIVLGSGVFIAEYITRPIRKLELAMQEVDESFEALVEVDTASIEIQHLTMHYNDMLKRISKLLLEISEKEKYLRDYELASLHSQINPHFLYNTLDTIVWMAEFEDSEAVINITKSLANFFRLSLNKGNDLITLEGELNHVREYLFIQSARYQDKLFFEINEVTDLSDYLVPKIIIQPLVENAIYHGIKEKDGSGLVKIDVELNPETIDILISDDGPGMNVEKLEKLRLSLSSKVNHISSKKLGGVGLRNVHERIKLYYGDESGITVDSKQGVGTTVKLTIKKQCTLT